MGHLHAVIERTGNGSRNHAAQRSRCKNDNSQEPGKKCGRFFGADDALFTDHDIDKALDTAGPFDEIEHRPDQEQRHDDNRVAIAGEGLYDIIKGSIDAGKNIRAECHARQENTYQKRDEYIAYSQSQYNRHQRWYNR